MITPSDPIEQIAARLTGCPCFGPEYPDCCVCGPTERVLRAHMHPQWNVEPLTEEQRAWCVAEIRSIEGWSDYQMPVKDSVLASDVLSAWRDYARDKGLIA